MSSKIKAAIRIRPFLKHQLKNGYTNSCISQHLERKQVQVDDGHTAKNFNFDYVFPPSASQQDLYHECQIDHLLGKTLKGYHATIFAYGQTGSGKTYTMHGEDSESCSGVIPKIFSRLFQQIDSNKERTYSVYLSFLQIYNERIFDLLNPAGLAQKGGAGLRLRWNKDEQFSVQNLYIFQCQNQQDLRKYFNTGLKNRIQASHKLNLQSSRSHSILTIRIESFDKTGSNSILSSKLELVDLAGSERIGQTGTHGQQAKQSIDINKSLFTLRQVISVLSQSRSKGQKDKTYVPYRDSKLTSILKQSIGGNSYCLMIACICPHDMFFDENVSTLTYATKASYITNQPIVNDDPRNKTINQLKKQVKGLTEQLSRANQHIEMLSCMPQQQGEMIQESRLVSPKMRRGSSQKDVNNGGEVFSERLVESINMVRQLLKSNKQLRQKLQQSNQRNDEKDMQIFEITRENQALKERVMTSQDYSPSHSQTAIRTSTAMSKKRHSSQQRTQIHHPTEQPNILTNNLVGNGGYMGFSAGGSRNNFNYWNSVQINQYIMNERGVDSVPTNFSRKEVATSQESRRMNPRTNSVHERTVGRNALTAKFSSRNWKHLNESSGKIMSFNHQNQMF